MSFHCDLDADLVAVYVVM